MSWGVSPWLYPVWDSLGFLDLSEYFLPHFRNFATGGVPQAGSRQPRVHSLSRKDPLGKEMATYSNILAWEIPWAEETGGLQSTEVTKESYTT